MIKNFQSFLNQEYLKIVKDRKDLIVEDGFSEELVLMLVEAAYHRGLGDSVPLNQHPANILYYIDEILEKKYGVH